MARYFDGGSQWALGFSERGGIVSYNPAIEPGMQVGCEVEMRLFCGFVLAAQLFGQTATIGRPQILIRTTSRSVFIDH